MMNPVFCWGRGSRHHNQQTAQWRTKNFPASAVHPGNIPAIFSPCKTWTMAAPSLMQGEWRKRFVFPPWLTCHHMIALFYGASGDGVAVRVLQWDMLATQHRLCSPRWMLILRVHTVVIGALSVFFSALCLSPHCRELWDRAPCYVKHLMSFGASWLEFFQGWEV